MRGEGEAHNMYPRFRDSHNFCFLISNDTLIDPFVWLTSYFEYIDIFYSMLIRIVL